MRKQLIAAVVAAGLGGAAMAQTVATVNGTKIDSKEVDTQVAAIVQGSQNQIQDTPQLRDAVTKRLITRTVLLQEARRLKLEDNDAYKNALQQAEAQAKQAGDDKKPNFKQDWAVFKDNLLVQFYLANVAQSTPVTQESVNAAYNAMKQFYQGTPEVQLGEIVTRDAGSANAAISALKAKKKFADVAKQYTIDPAVKESGSIPQNYVPLKDLESSAPPVYQAVKDLKKGQFTATPVQGNGIFAVFYVNDKRKITVPDVKEMTPMIVQSMRNAYVQQTVGQLYQKANIK